ncbi:MAG: hypothetical protein D6799_04010 [Bacteroidetes bacterium]|nr:MAG: hypothetical protein D6799_04010 [Bacteroidota bacterium]
MQRNRFISAIAFSSFTLNQFTFFTIVQNVLSQKYKSLIINKLFLIFDNIKRHSPFSKKFHFSLFKT